MKLAEALSIRADLKNRIAKLKSRLKRSAKVKGNNLPYEDRHELFKELDECLSQFEEIDYQIARKDVLELRRSVIRAQLNYVVENDPHGKKKLKDVRAEDMDELRKATGKYFKQIRNVNVKLSNLDMKLQSINWSVDLI